MMIDMCKSWWDFFFFLWIVDFNFLYPYFDFTFLFFLLSATEYWVIVFKKIIYSSKLTKIKIIDVA